ncbi:MAG: flagellin [Balneolaceae bacterium]|nr:flagellin [Balneolaceae bacterium]
MRITQNLIYNRLQGMLSRNREELAKYQQQLASGKAVIRASDGAVEFSTSRIIQEQIRKDGQYQSNINAGLRQARTVQESLDGMVDTLIDLKSTAVQGSNDSIDAPEREKLAEQVVNVRERLMDLGNVQFNGVHLFGGTNTENPVFSLNGAAAGGVEDVANSDALVTRISEHNEVKTSVTGTELRATGSGDLFAMVENVEDALRANDRTALNAELDNVESALDHVTKLASRIGSNINRLEFVHDKYESGIIEKEGEVSRLTDADYAEAISNFQKFETSYQAALSAHSRMTRNTLLNYL